MRLGGSSTITEPGVTWMFIRFRSDDVERIRLRRSFMLFSGLILVSAIGVGVWTDGDEYCGRSRLAL